MDFAWKSLEFGACSRCSFFHDAYTSLILKIVRVSVQKILKNLVFLIRRINLWNTLEVNTTCGTR